MEIGSEFTTTRYQNEFEGCYQLLYNCYAKCSSPPWFIGMLVILMEYTLAMIMSLCVNYLLWAAIDTITLKTNRRWRLIQSYEISSVLGPLVDYETSSVLGPIVDYEISSVLGPLVDYEISSVLGPLVDYEIGSVLGPLVDYEISSVLGPLVD